jgi:2-polyprenyl-6-methoxyphenol hydroxylase-like FAD-dependent oxidoreductase
MAILSRYVPVDLSRQRVVVAGAGVAGLATALALGERGAEVVVLDADPSPTASDPDEAFASWTRRRVPQFRHSHAFLARVRNIVMRAYPEIYAELLAAGARELRLLDFPPPALRPLVPEPGDEDLAALGCRRAVFEWVVRRWIERQGWARFETETVVTGLEAEAGARPRVTGVAVEQRGERRTIEADLVVDATGRGSKAAAWLRAIGAGEPSEEKSPSSVLYYTRHYRLLAPEFPMPNDEPTMADLGWVKFAIFPADSRTFSITFATPVALPRLKVLNEPLAFDRMIAALPGLARYTAPDIAEPMALGERDVLAMGGLENCRRRFVDAEGHPLATGLFVIGDAAYHTNPLYGRGCTQAFIHANLLGEALDATAGDLDAAGAMLDQSARVEIEPFYRASVLADYGAARKAERYRRLETSADARGDGAPASLVDRLADSFFEEGVIVASRVDPVVFRAFVRMFNMMDTPEDAFASPELIGRIASIWMRGRRVRERHLPKGPPAEATIAACERAANRGERATA